MAGTRKKTGGKPKPKGGRVTPSAKASASSAARASTETPAAAARRPKPGLLLLLSLLWFTIGIVVLTSVRAAWRYLPGIAALVLGLICLRAAAAMISRAPRRTR